MAPPTRNQKMLFALSGNECAFRGCDEPMSELRANSTTVILGEIAHIVASSTQGPRGRVELEDRDDISNLLLVCRKHHKRIDADPHTYSVPVLKKIKADHEHRHSQVTEEPPEPEHVTELLSASVLPVDMLPAQVYAAVTEARSNADVLRSMRCNPHSTAVTPFVLTEGRLLLFDDPADDNSPFRKVVDPSTVLATSAESMWVDPDLRRRYVELLNKGIKLHLTRTLGLRFDEEHRRFYFPGGPGQRDRVELRTKANRKQEREVVRPRYNKRTGEIAEWWHDAVSLSFQQFAPKQWGLTLLPRFHLTVDGEELLNSRWVGRRITRRKSSMFNEQYYDRLHFWREFLSAGSPRMVVRFGSQSLVVESDFPTVQLTWAGISDKEFTPPPPHADDLLSAAAYQQAVDGQFEWDDFDEDENWDDLEEAS